MYDMDAEITMVRPTGYTFAMTARKRAVENARTIVISAITGGLRAFLFACGSA